MELLQHDEAFALAQEWVAAGVVEIAEVGKSFPFSAGWESPIKLHMDVACEVPGLMENIRSAVDRPLREELEKYYKIPVRFLTFVGVPSGGNPFARMLSTSLGAKHCNSQKKLEGTETIFEFGSLTGTQRWVVVFEDVITTGGQSRKLIKLVLENGRIVCLLVTMFSYNFAVAMDTVREQRIHHGNVVSFEPLLRALRASDNKRFTPQVLQTIADWHTKPNVWKASNWR